MAIPMLLGSFVAQAQSPTSWHREISFDHAISINFPCVDRDANRQNERDAFQRKCNDRGMTFQAIETEWPFPIDQIFSLAKNDKSGKVSLMTLAGHRAFRAQAAATEPLKYQEIVELRPGILTILSVYAQNAAKIDSAQYDQAKFEALEFLDSLQVIAG